MFDSSKFNAKHGAIIGTGLGLVGILIASKHPEFKTLETKEIAYYSIRGLVLGIIPWASAGYLNQKVIQPLRIYGENKLRSYLGKFNIDLERR